MTSSVALSAPLGPAGALKLRLTNGGDQTLIDVLASRVNRFLHVLSLGAWDAPFWCSAAFLCVLVWSVGLLISGLLGEFDPKRLQIVPVEAIGVLLAFASLIIFKFYLDSFITRLRDEILDSIIAPSKLDGLEGWLDQLFNYRLHAVFCLVYGLGFGLYVVRELSRLYDGFIGFGAALTCCLVAFIWGIPMYFLLLFLLLPGRLSRCEYRLFKVDPSSSEVVARLSGLFSGMTYLYGVVAMGSMIYLAYAGLLRSMVIPSIIVAWLPIILLFSLGQHSMRTVIARGKLSTLGEIQSNIERIQAEEELSEKETLEKINRLMDFHDRIKGTRSSALNLRSGLDLLNSLLLPIVGSLLGNIQDIQEILNR